MSKLSVLLLLAGLLFFSVPVAAEIPNEIPFDVNADSALLMDVATGTVLYSKNANMALPPASVTKIMTLLLFMEGLTPEIYLLTMI